MGMADLRSMHSHLQRNELGRHASRPHSGRALRQFVSVMLVIMLALPFALGSLRNAGQGSHGDRVFIGAGFVC
jgi:hypothetical protein